MSSASRLHHLELELTRASLFMLKKELHPSLGWDFRIGKDLISLQIFLSEGITYADPNEEDVRRIELTRACFSEERVIHPSAQVTWLTKKYDMHRQLGQNYRTLLIESRQPVDGIFTKLYPSVKNALIQIERTNAF